MLSKLVSFFIGRQGDCRQEKKAFRIFFLFLHVEVLNSLLFSPSWRCRSKQNFNARNHFLFVPSLDLLFGGRRGVPHHHETLISVTLKKEIGGGGRGGGMDQVLSELVTVSSGVGEGGCYHVLLLTPPPFRRNFGRLFLTCSSRHYRPN